MERHARREGQINTKQTDTKRMTSVDRLFLSNDVDKYIDVNLYEEDFYSQTTDISSYFTSKKPNKEYAQMFQDPAFFTLYEEKKEEFDPAEDTDFLTEEYPRTRKHSTGRKQTSKKPEKKKKAKKVLSKEEKKKTRDHQSDLNDLSWHRVGCRLYTCRKIFQQQDLCDQKR